MENPWVALPTKPPYVLPADEQVINGRPDIRLDLLPVPYIGDPDRAALYLLTLNPGVSPGEEAQLANAYYMQQNRRSLTFESASPFWPLDPGLADTPGYAYWNKCLGKLGAELGKDFLLERVMCVELFPYHSWKYVGLSKVVPSQGFSFDLVRQAVAQRKPVVLLRGRKPWLANVPELGSSGYYELNTPLNSVISRGNLPHGEFEKLIDACRATLRAIARRYNPAAPLGGVDRRRTSRQQDGVDKAAH